MIKKYIYKYGDVVWAVSLLVIPFVSLTYAGNTMHPEYSIVECMGGVIMCMTIALFLVWRIERWFVMHNS